jgi:uncharacterized membrane protein YheB (UPF0754 family)
MERQIGDIANAVEEIQKAMDKCVQANETNESLFARLDDFVTFAKENAETEPSAAKKRKFFKDEEGNLAENVTAKVAAKLQDFTSVVECLCTRQTKDVMNISSTTKKIADMSEKLLAVDGEILRMLNEGIHSKMSKFDSNLQSSLEAQPNYSANIQRILEIVENLKHERDGASSPDPCSATSIQICNMLSEVKVQASSSTQRI